MKYIKEQAERQWQQCFMIAMQYYIEFSNLDVSYDQVYKEFALGRWISRQRVLYNKGKLSEEKIASLDFIEMIWFKHRKVSYKEKSSNQLTENLDLEIYRQEWMKYYCQFKESSEQNEELKLLNMGYL